MGLPTTVLSLFVAALSLNSASCDVQQQTWSEQPANREVNPGGDVLLSCVINDMRGQCRWEKDGTPVGIFPGKYEWANGDLESGDCSLRILDAKLAYDDGVWQCSVTPSSFLVRDALISEGAQVVIRESPTSISIQRVGDSGSGAVVARAGEEVELECAVSGGNPPSLIKWFAGDRQIESGHRQDNRRSSPEARTWVSVSRLVLPVSKEDDGAKVRCVAHHPTLPEKPLSAVAALAIHYPPSVRIESAGLDYLEDGKDPATLRCVADSNPPATILWRKDGLDGIFSPDAEITFSPVTRHTAGLYSCTAENALGMSEPAFIELDVKYPPSILSVGPSKVVSAQMMQKAVLTCEAEGKPSPKYQWLQKLPTQEVLIRGYEKQLVIDNVTYDHQGEFVCKAVNVIRGEERAVQSDPIKVEVSGAPQVMRYTNQHEVSVQKGEDASLEVLFCGDPLPLQSWYLGDISGNSGNHVILASGTGHNRFVAESARKADREDCYYSTLRINGAHPTDTHAYQLRLSNGHGNDTHTVHLVVRDHVSQESLIAVILVAVILTLLVLVLVCIYCCKSERGSGGGGCCGRSGGSGGKPSAKEFKPADLESEKTDVDSTHSSNLSNFPEKVVVPGSSAGSAVIPPDALYATSEKHHKAHNMIIASKYYNSSSNDAMFNDSKVRSAAVAVAEESFV